MNLKDGLGFDQYCLNLIVDCNNLDKMEYIRNGDDGNLKAKEYKRLDLEINESEEDEDYSWMEPLIKADYQRFQDETYFCAINYGRRRMKKGDQAFLCYGCRTNYFLLQSYGFCFIDNLHESFKFYVKLDLVTSY